MGGGQCACTVGSRYFVAGPVVLPALVVCGWDGVGVGGVFCLRAGFVAGVFLVFCVGRWGSCRWRYDDCRGRRDEEAPGRVWVVRKRMWWAGEYWCPRRERWMVALC